MMFPLTKYLCALIDVAEKRCTMDDVRTRWKAGDFKGVRADWAAEYAKRLANNHSTRR